MQKLLRVVKTLHDRGYEKLRIIPSLSNNGMAWRCSFIADGVRKGETLIASSWIYDFFPKENKEIELNIEELADLFEKKHASFLRKCKGENKIYLNWYSSMLELLKEEELPYAFGDYSPAAEHWETSEGNRIQTLHDESSHYFND